MNAERSPGSVDGGVAATLCMQHWAEVLARVCRWLEVKERQLVEQAVLLGNHSSCNALVKGGLAFLQICTKKP